MSPQKIKFEDVVYSLFKTESRVLIKYGKFPDGDLYTDITQNVFDVKHKFTAQTSKSCSLQNLFGSIGVNDTDSCVYIHTPPNLELSLQYLAASV
jgi:predicted transcriptional regulator